MAVFWQEWQAVGLAAVSMVLVLVGLVYAIGMGFNLPKVKGWARNELYQALASAFILGFLAVMLPSLNGIVTGLAGPLPSGCSGGTGCTFDSGGACDDSVNNYMCKPGCGGYNVAIDHSQCFLSDMKNRLALTYASLQAASMALGYGLSFKYSLAHAGQGVGFAVLPGLFMVMDLMGLMSMFVGTGFAFTWAQSFIFDFIRLKLVTLLPIGLALRSFPFTRGVGAAMIALVIGLYMVYPLMTTLESWIVSDNLDSYNYVQSGSWGAFKGAGDFGNGIAQLMSIFEITTYIVVIAMLFLPIFNLTIAFAFMKEFARLLGGDIDVSSLAKIL